MRKFLVLIFLSCAFVVKSQETQLYLSSFVKKDTVQLRWVPSSAEVLIEGLKNGFQIERKEISSGASKVIDILPYNERKTAYLNDKDSFNVSIAEYVQELLKAKTEEAKNLTFALLSISASSSKLIGKISGVYYEEISIDGSKFEYQVKVKGTNLISNKVSLNASVPDKNGAFTELIGVSRLDLQEAYLEWEADEMQAYYGGYFIYKSLDNKKFSKLNEVPLYYFTSQFEEEKTKIDYVDKDVEEGNTYYYKIQPLNYFADPGIESNTVEVYIQKTLSGNCIIDTVTMDGFDREIVGFYDGIESEVITEYILYRGDKIDSTYQLLEKVSTEERQFEFNFKSDLTSGDENYFKVAAISEDKDTAFSFPYYHFSLDQIPPGLPTKFEGFVDTAGIARLKWIKPEDNDIKGYRIYRANSLRDEFIEVTRRLSVNEYYADTLSLNTLTNEVYYKVNTIDKNFNNSPLSEPILIMKPDTIAPVAGVFRKYNISKDGVYLAWNNSGSEDIKNQYVLRMESIGKIDTILTFIKEFDTLLDLSGTVGKEYSYFLLAEDKSGNTKLSHPLNLKYELGYRQPPTIIKSEARRDSALIFIEWSPIEEEIYSIQVYKSKLGDKMRLYKTIRENITFFEDDKLNINNEYHYKIKVIYKSGISSKMSEEIIVNY